MRDPAGAGRGGGQITREYGLGMGRTDLLA